jgi:hypothetical protein
LSLWEALNLSYDMLRICPIFQLSMLRELIADIHLVDHILGCLCVIKCGCRNKNRWRGSLVDLCRILNLHLLSRINHLWIIHRSLLHSRSWIVWAVHACLLLRVWAHFIVAFLGGHTEITWNVLHELTRRVILHSMGLIHLHAWDHVLSVHLRIHLILVLWESDSRLTHLRWS